MFRQKLFQFMLENVAICYFLHCVGRLFQVLGPAWEKQHSATKLQPSCQWFITVSPGRSEMDSGRIFAVVVTRSDR